jgi:cytochrome P450
MPPIITILTQDRRCFASSERGYKVLFFERDPTMSRSVGPIVKQGPHTLISLIDWTPINIFQTTIRMTSIISSCIVSGHELAQSPEWIDLSVSYITNVLKTVGKLRHTPPILRPIVVHFIPEMKHVKSAYQTAKVLLDPILKERAEAAKVPGYVKPNDILQWITDRMASENLHYDQATIQLSLALGSIHTTAITTIQIIYELASRPEEYEMLREEITEATGTSKSVDIDKHALTKLRKLDSFMKEVHRLHPMNHGMLLLFIFPFSYSFSKIEENSSLLAW